MKRKQRPEMSPDELIAAWVRDHGEAVAIKDAAQLMGVSTKTIYRRMGEGHLKATPDKRVLVRSLCAYANGFTA